MYIHNIGERERGKEEVKHTHLYMYASTSPATSICYGRHDITFLHHNVISRYKFIIYSTVNAKSLSATRATLLRFISKRRRVW